MAFKYISLIAIPIERAVFVFISAHSISRVFPILLIRSSCYAREGESKAQHTRQGVDNVSLIVAIFFGIIPLSFFGYKFIAIYIAISVLFLIIYRFYLHSKIGGFTGDTLGALQQFTELFFYLTYISLPATWTESFI